MNLRDLTVEELRAASLELENRMRDMRAKRLEIAHEMESRFPEEIPETRTAQAVAVEFIESEATTYNPGDPEPDLLPAVIDHQDAPKPKRRRLGRKT